MRVAAATAARLGLRVDITVVDDGSIDSSVTALRAIQSEINGVKLVLHDRNRGYGGALKSGFKAAHGDWVFYTDGDGQYDPAEMASLLQRAGEDVDVVQGWKSRRADGRLRTLAGRLYHHAIAVMFGIRVRDVDCDFRLIRRSLLDRVDLSSDSGAICVEMMRRFQDAGARIVEVPVSHFPRKHGRSQFFRLRHIAATLAELVSMRRRMNRRSMPSAHGTRRVRADR